MQSFRERSGFHGNQHCYQQEPQELSRLESYRHHHSQSRQGYEPHSLAAAGMSTAGAGSKDCYGQQTYPVYTSATQTKKTYRGAKTPNQHLPTGYSNHMGTGYTAQYMSEGHLQQKWDESAQMTQFEQDMVGRLESGVSGSSQYLEQNMLAISQSQCHLPSQSSAPTYTSSHQQGLPPNPAPSPLMYPQGHLHFPQHSQPPSSSSSSYMEKCNTMSHSYKGYGIPSNTQYGRQLSNHSSLKQSGYRPQNNYGYQQTPSRSGFEQGSLQGMSGTQDNLQKFQHYNQPQQNYCITDISVRSPEQYYQTCSPSSNHSPARSVGRSPSYNSTPSPLMPNPDSFQYGQPPINPGASSSTGLQEQNMLIPPHTHSSPSVNHQSQSYSGSMKERFSEKLLSNPSLWSLNALTSQVENISNNVQQLLLSEALMANKKTSKRNHPKKGEDYRGQLKGIEESSCPDNQHGNPSSDAYSIPRSMTAELQEGGYSSSTEDQMDRNYYYFGQEKSQAHTQTHSRLSLDTVSTCSLNSADDVSIRSGDSVRSLQSVASEDNLNCDPRVQRVLTGEEPNSSLHCIRDERSPISVTAPSPMKQESNSPPDIKRSESTLKENFEESAWTERMADEEEIVQRKLSAEHECKGEVTEKQEKWLEDEKGPSLFQKTNKTVSEEGYSYETEENIYQGLQNKCDSEKVNSEEMDCFSELNHKCNERTEIKSEHFKSEPQINAEMLVKTSPENSDTDLYLPENEHSKSENSLESPTCAEGPVGTLEEQPSVLSHNSTEVRDEKENLTTTAEVINNRARPQESFAEVCSTFEEMGNMPQVNTETAESFAQDTPHRGSERRSAICDIAPQHHTAKSGISALNDKTTPLAQARDHHIDHSDAKVLEPDSPQLPGKSILHSAPSWADTPPSPKKGDEDMEPGISCPSAVTPSAKPEPMAPSAHTRMFGKKHARGRRRLMHSSPGIRRQLSVEGDSVPSSAQNSCMPSSKSTLIPDQMETAHQDISSQTPKLATESLPSRMCTRSYGSQSSPKVCPQERRKPGPRPGPKSGPKPGVKPGPKPGPKSNLKPGPKPSQKSISKPGPKPCSKPEVMPGVKPGPKPSLKCQGSIENAKPGSKPNSKPGPKPGPKSASKLSSKAGALPGEILPKSSQTTTESKQIVGSMPKGPGRPRGITKIKSIKQDETVQITKDHTKNTHCTHEHILQDVTKALTLDTLSAVDATKDETVGSTLESTLDSSCVKSLVRDQKSMVLRSQKQTREKLTEDKEEDIDKSTEVPSAMFIHAQIQDVTVDHSCKTESSHLELPKQRDISTNSLLQPNEEIVCIKRKSSLPSSETKKMRKGMQENQVKTQDPQINTVTEVPITKGKRKRGQHMQAESVNTTVTTDIRPNDDISDMPSVPPQCPTKTKYLPPRKGRGLKYEAMVQKITSPGSKKQPVNIQPDIVLEEPTSKPVPQVPEQRETIKAPEVTHKEGENTTSTQETQTTGIQTPRKKRRKWATVESSYTPDVALEPGSLVINTPRLAKQRAIKNNHEMHLKQRKKRRKGSEPQESIPIVEQQPPIQTDILPPPPPSFSSPETSEQTQHVEPQTELCLPLIKPKRGRRPSLKKKQEELSSQTEEDYVINKKKPGPKKKVLNVLKVVVKRPKMKTKCSNDLPPTVKGTLSDLHPALGDSKCSFRPYVHIDSSLDLASLCTIVNRPEEQQMLSQARKKSVAKMNNLVTVTKAVSNSSVMLQGPLVNKSLIDRCLTCCLCGKPANYRELGDLCGPYYPEDCIPRKMLSSTHRNDFRQNSICANEAEVSCITKQINSPSACEKEGAIEGHSGHPRRGKRAIREQLRTRPTLRMRFKRLLVMQSRLSGAFPPAGEEGSGTTLQRLQMEAEAKEHWAHEACAVWTTGIILVAGKLFGLTEAVQKAAHTKCSRCQGEGASICCCWKSCTQKYHYVCAKEMGCTFKEETFSIQCPKHKAM